MIVEVLDHATGVAPDRIELCAGWTDFMMKDQIVSKTDRQQKENQNLARASGNTDRRLNLDEDARYVIEGLDRRKQMHMDQK